MYEFVKSEEQQKAFNSLWESAWEEKGYELEYSIEPLAQLLLKYQNQYIATIELKELSSSKLCETFDFEAFPFVKEKYNQVVEIDKIAIAKEYRGFEVLNILVSALIHFAEDYDVPYYVALIEPRFFLALRKHYRVNVKKLGSSFYYKGDDVIPVFINVKEIRKNKKQFSWFLEKVES